MELIPTITMKKREILNQKEETDKIFNQLKEEDLIYILDLDGLEKDKPNLCTFQRLSKKYKLWLDYGPRTHGDVVDAFMAGAERVTIRNKLGPKINIIKLREITENQIYTDINLEKQNNQADKIFYKEADGLINLYNKEKMELNNKYYEIINKYKTIKPIYSYEKQATNIQYWKNLGIKGLLIDINKIEEFKKYDL